MYLVYTKCNLRLSWSQVLCDKFLQSIKYSLRILPARIEMFLASNGCMLRRLAYPSQFGIFLASMECMMIAPLRIHKFPLGIVAGELHPLCKNNQARMADKAPRWARWSHWHTYNPRTLGWKADR
jgi:hypothetical protein